MESVTLAFAPPVFNPENADPIFRQDPDLTFQLLESFRTILRKELNRATESLGQVDLTALGFAMHKIAPNFMYLALEEGYRASRHLENMVKQKKSREEIVDLFQPFMNWCQLLLPQIDRYIALLKVNAL